ncbi:hypothetical protein [Candidatus Absconditicoccus praedator]|uniref:hypothetical protein n=1 Tax=Candidatus Absconditicoccus praedator TaxID=2735562 RepID=UPI001E647832|nr:hypothetical protein [Candidatus Absconditicoccus praedator]UFX83017.1 hypothetical protein HLG78_02680 [Candidatus Absconditicoccus praedator]
MFIIPLFFIVFGLLIIIFPEFLAYLVGGFFILLGVNILLGIFFIKKGKKRGDGVRIAGYKIYKD